MKIKYLLIILMLTAYFILLPEKNSQLSTNAMSTKHNVITGNTNKKFSLSLMTDYILHLSKVLLE